MTFESLMHVTFYTARLDEMVDFYTNVLGGTLKVVIRASLYLDRPQSGYHKVALEDPSRVIIVYIELAPGQFVELFPAGKSAPQFRPRASVGMTGFSHFALTVADIHQARIELEGRGLVFDSPISMGPSHTCQMWAHDPDGNEFEVMQFTPQSFQLVGHVM